MMTCDDHEKLIPLSLSYNDLIMTVEQFNGKKAFLSIS